MEAADDDRVIGATFGGGRYEILALLGRGGMGAVYRARDTASNADVALKTLHRRLAAEAPHLARFRREAEAASALSHPNVVAVLDHGVERDGTPWLVMEILEGESLSRLAAREAPLDVQRVVRLGRQLAYALGAVHDVGVVHRDLKPGNVMVAARGGVDEIKVVDFGIARFFGTGTYEKLTSTGQIIGTPNYMAPEQAFGGVVDGRTDIYAVGSILYALLTGHPPHGRGEFHEVLTRLLGDERVRLGQSHPELGPIVDVIEGCLAFDPAQRYASMAELDVALARLDPSPMSTLMEWSPRVPLHSSRLAPDPVLDAVAEVAQTAFLRAARGRGPSDGAPPVGDTAHPAIAPPSPAAPGPGVVAAPTAAMAASPPASPRGRGWIAAVVGGVLAVGAAVTAALIVSQPTDSDSPPMSPGHPDPVAVTAVPAIAPTQLDYPSGADAPGSPATPTGLDAPPVDPAAVPAADVPGADAGRGATARPSMRRASRPPETSTETSMETPMDISMDAPVSAARFRMTAEVLDPGVWTVAEVRTALGPALHRGNACVSTFTGGEGAPVAEFVDFSFSPSGGIRSSGVNPEHGGVTDAVRRCTRIVADGFRAPPATADASRGSVRLRLGISETGGSFGF